MARSPISSQDIDLQSDAGSVLWSFVQGEQLEYPVTLNFVGNTSLNGYEYEAVIMEADNVSMSTEMPLRARTGGVNTTLTVRVPLYRGTWSGVTQYNTEDLVSYNPGSGVLYYKLISGTNYVSVTTPDVDTTNWELYVPNKIYIQFPAALSVSPAWAVQPLSTYPIFGFFELRVTEPTPSAPLYRRTWKPMRGTVEIHYSPTHLV